MRHDGVGERAAAAICLAFILGLLLGGGLGAAITYAAIAADHTNAEGPCTTTRA